MKAIICLFVLLAACCVEVHGAVAAIGGSCATDTCPTNTGCESTTTKCLLKVGVVCGSDGAHCATGSTCGSASGAVCTCAAGTEASSDELTCTTIPAGNYGGACKANDVCSEANTKCESDKCVCTGKRETTKCSAGASGLVISVVALMLMAIAGRITWA